MYYRTMSDSQIIAELAALVDKLGGTKAAAAALDLTMQQVSNAKKAGAFPPRLYLVHRNILAARGIAAAPSLWNMEPVKGQGETVCPACGQSVERCVPAEPRGAP